MNPSIFDILKKHWGYDTFRPLQREIIESVLSGHDTLGLMPTGGGKSVTFQVPALLMDGFTIVVTPLIALMKDQIDNLKARRVRAVYFHSGQSQKERSMAWEKVTSRSAKFIYIAPERLKSKSFINEIRNLDVSMIVVDEAHCISQWGYDFRPAYLNIKTLRKLFPNAVTLALTATAPLIVREDIKRELQFGKDANTFAMSFRRDNISYIVRQSDAKLSEILHILSNTQGSSIVYVRSRRRSREISDYLVNAGISSTFYHAGLDNEEKNIRQDAWIKGQIRVMVATNAFGMGIDKPDVRVVVHFEMPPSLEEYYQEAGRAGRDGLSSYAVLLTAATDKALLRRRLTLQFPPREVIRRVYTRLCVFLHKPVGEGYNCMEDFDLDKFCVTYGMDIKTVRASLGLLEKAGYIEFIEEVDNLSRVMISVDRDDLYDTDVRTAENEKVLVAILRKYPGLFTEFVSINEATVARESGLTRDEVYNVLLELSRMKIMHYIPRRKTPMIIFTTAREDEKYVVIGKDIYEDRQERLRQRVEKMIDYGFSTEGCRVSRMLEYLGESDSSDCQYCDVCRDKVKKRKRKIADKDIGQALMNFIRENEYGVSPAMIEHNFPELKDQALNMVRELCREGLIRLENGCYFFNR